MEGTVDLSVLFDEKNECILTLVRKMSLISSDMDSAFQHRTTSCVVASFTKRSTIDATPLSMASCNGVCPEGAAFEGWYPSNDLPRRSIMKRTTDMFPALIDAWKGVRSSLFKVLVLAPIDKKSRRALIKGDLADIPRSTRNITSSSSQLRAATCRSESCCIGSGCFLACFPRFRGAVTSRSCSKITCFTAAEFPAWAD
jgi:hypothetical protein